MTRKRDVGADDRIGPENNPSVTPYRRDSSLYTREPLKEVEEL